MHLQVICSFHAQDPVYYIWLRDFVLTSSSLLSVSATAATAASGAAA